MANAYIGEIRMYGGPKAPDCWLLCDGSSLEISHYAVLFTLLGTTYGGDGITHFNLPNLNGQVPLGEGKTASGTYTLGQTLGAESVVLSKEHMPGHNHLVVAAVNPYMPTPVPGPQVGFGPVDPSLHFYVDTNVGKITGVANFSPQAVASSGGEQAHDNIMPSAAINYIICYDGVFPSNEEA